MSPFQLRQIFEMIDVVKDLHPTRFGPPAQQIEAKESLAAFASQSGARLVVSLLGGTKPSSIVSAIELEGSGKEKLAPKDLF